MHYTFEVTCPTLAIYKYKHSLHKQYMNTLVSIYKHIQVFVWAKTPERGLQSFFLVLPCCSSRKASLTMWCSLNFWNTDTTNDNKSEWWLSMPNCVSSWKVIPRAQFAMVRRFQQKYDAQCSGILCHLLLCNRSMTGPRWWCAQQLMRRLLCIYS